MCSFCHTHNTHNTHNTHTQTPCIKQIWQTDLFSLLKPKIVSLVQLTGAIARISFQRRKKKLFLSKSLLFSLAPFSRKETNSKTTKWSVGRQIRFSAKKLKRTLNPKRFQNTTNENQNTKTTSTQTEPLQKKKKKKRGVS